jgi:hypothetical protein
MAKSRFIAGRSKKSTILVSKRTLEEAVQRANMLVESLMESNPSDPEIDKIEEAVSHMSRILKADPQQMRQDGAASISDYMDDAKMPEEARKLKSEVDMILKMNRQQRKPRQQVDYVPDSAVAELGVAASRKQADGGAAFATDRDEKGEAKAPEKLEVPRLAKKKKEAVPEEPAAAVPAPAAAVPAQEPVPAAGSTNPIDYIPTEILIKVIGDLPKEDDFPQNKGKQDAVVQLTEILKTRPVLPPEQEGGKAPAPAAPAQSTAPALAEPAAVPVAASAKKADLGDHAMGDNGTISSGSGASAQVGQNGSSAAPEQISANPEPQKAEIDLGGLSLASLEEEKTADDYRIQDYKLTEEGIRPSGGKPDLQEQEEHGVPPSVDFPNEMQEVPMSASVNKEAVSPEGWGGTVEHMKKHKDIDNPFALAYYMKEKGDKPHYKESNDEPDSVDRRLAALEHWKSRQAEMHTFLASKYAKYASAGYGGGWYTSYKPMEVEEDGGRTPEIAEAHAGLEDNTGIDKPAVVAPIKLSEQRGLKTGAKVAADMTTSKAVKQSEQLGDDLKKMYLEAKPLTQVNDTRAVREAVEAIFRAADMFDEATKALSKQRQQEESEAAAAEIKEKNKGKKSSFEGLALAAAE